MWGTWERRRNTGNGSVLGEALSETLIKAERKKTVLISKEPAKLRHRHGARTQTLELLFTELGKAEIQKAL